MVAVAYLLVANFLLVSTAPLVQRIALEVLTSADWAGGSTSVKEDSLVGVGSVFDSVMPAVGA